MRRVFGLGKVQKILDVNCVKCHGVLEQKGGLELDTPSKVMKGGEAGAVVVPGSLSKVRYSRIWQRDLIRTCHRRNSCRIRIRRR